MHRTTVTDWSSIPKLIIDYPWTKTKEDVTDIYSVDQNTGLSEERVRRDFEQYGPNGNTNVVIKHFINIFM
jgi:hypothetical protein